MQLTVSRFIEENKQMYKKIQIHSIAFLINVLVLDRLLVNHLKLFFIAKMSSVSRNPVSGVLKGKLEHREEIILEVGIPVPLKLHQCSLAPASL